LLPPRDFSDFTPRRKGRYERNVDAALVASFAPWREITLTQHGEIAWIPQGDRATLIKRR
jgi:hypothetical protein